MLPSLPPAHRRRPHPLCLQVPALTLATLAVPAAACSQYDNDHFLLEAFRFIATQQP